MKAKQIKAEVHRLLSAGQPKDQVYQQLLAAGAKARTTAVAIASYAKPELVLQHARKIDALIVITWLQLAFAVLVAIGLGLQHGLGFLAFMVAFVGGFCYLFVWGFTHNRAWAYNGTFLLGLGNAHKALSGFTEAPLMGTVILIVSWGPLFYTMYVRSKLFPDFAFMSPPKKNGQYVFKP